MSRWRTAAPGTISLDLNGNAIASSDKVAATGSTVDITGATLALSISNMHSGDTFTIISVPGTSTATQAVIGTFNGLPTSGSTITIGGQQFFHQLRAGGDGNDVALTAVGVGITLGSTVLNGGSRLCQQSELLAPALNGRERVLQLQRGRVSLRKRLHHHRHQRHDRGADAQRRRHRRQHPVDRRLLGRRLDGDLHQRRRIQHPPWVTATTPTSTSIASSGDFDNSHTVDFNDFLNFNTTFNRATNDPLYIGAGRLRRQRPDHGEYGRLQRLPDVQLELQPLGGHSVPGPLRTDGMNRSEGSPMRPLVPFRPSSACRHSFGAGSPSATVERFTARSSGTGVLQRRKPGGHILRLVRRHRRQGLRLRLEFRLADAPTSGQVVDGDQGTGGTQSAIFGVTAFATIGAALAAVGSSGTVVVNGGVYGESPVVTGGRTFQLSGDVSVSSLDSAPGTTVDLQANTLTTGDFTGNDTIAGSIIASGGLVKIASDTLTLSGVDSFTGGATVSAGSLIANGSLADSAVSVASVATLGGIGTAGAVLSNGGTINPGDSGGPGTLTATGNVTLGAGTLALDLAGIASNVGAADFDGGRPEHGEHGRLQRLPDLQLELQPLGADPVPRPLRSGGTKKGVSEETPRSVFVPSAECTLPNRLAK